MATTGPALWPGSSTFPNTNVYPGQGVNPIIRILLSTDPVSTSIPAYTDITSKMRTYSINRGRNSELDDFDAGTASAVLDNRDRALDSSATFAGNAISPLNRIWIYSEFSSERQSRFKGYAESWTESYDPSGNADAIQTVQAVDEFKLLARQTLPASGSVTGTAAVLFHTVLDQIGSHAPRQLSASAGSATAMTLSYTGQTPIDALRQIALSDFLLSSNSFSVRIGRDGAIVYERPTTGSISFGDGGGSELPYLTLAFDFSDAYLINQVTFNGTGGSTYTGSDATSIAKYGLRSTSYTVLFDAAANGASATTNYFGSLKAPSTPFERVTSLTPKMADAETARVVLGMDLVQSSFDVLRTPPGGGSRIDHTTWLNQISEGGTPGVPLQVTFGCARP